MATPSTLKLARRVFVVGGDVTPFIGKGHPDFVHKKHADYGKRENPTLEQYITTSVQGALRATGVRATAVQRAYIGNFAGELFSSQGHLGAALIGADDAFRFLPSMRVEGACASGGLAMASAVDAIQAGADTVLVAGAEVQTTVSARQGGDYLARASHYARQRAIDEFTFPALFAERMRAYRTAFPHVSEEDVARVSVKAYANANRNPKAHMHAARMPLDVAATASERNPCFLANDECRDWLKVSDCSQVSDGGAAMLLLSEEGVRAAGKTLDECVELLAVSVATDNLYSDGEPTALDATRVAAERAYAATGVTAADVRVAEVHDCFSIAEVMMYEALGFAERGRGTDVLKRGDFDIDGRVPVNTGGGLIGFGHPVGATGVKQVLEVFRQMKGQCGDYQMARRPDVGLTANMGGSDKTAVVGIYRNVV